MKGACKSYLGNKEQKTIFPNVSRSDAHFGFARLSFTCSLSAQVKVRSGYDMLKTGAQNQSSRPIEKQLEKLFFTLFLINWVQRPRCNFSGTSVKDLRQI